ncbi:AAA family ATPase [Maridesulfovibrio zosterae]|uniref:AAA family ATPase n=1 Tax=Maridesulfovibrio zosterae TaxID=82171 RepID=UPI000403058E|nr:AAA family ATPase [Maridesulfovibrio zosterae]
MSKTLTEIAQELKDNPKKVQLIYAFNGVGKTRLSRELKELIMPKGVESEDTDDHRTKVLYYNAFTEDLFYWDNDLEGDSARKLKIQPNAYTKWVLQEQGQDKNAISHFQYYTSDKLTPRFNEEYIIEDKDGKNITVPAFSEVTFSYERGNDERTENVKISKGEESNFIWSIFYSLIEQVVEELNVAEPDERENNQFDKLEYIFIDDPVSSLDENHLIEMAVQLAQLVKSSTSEVKFIITTHNPLFFNVLSNEFNNDEKSTGYKRGAVRRYRLEKYEDGTHKLADQPNDSPFSYHLYLKSELEKAIQEGQIQKYHFNFLRNILEKTSTFLGYKRWAELLPKTDDGRPNPYEERMINLFSHSKHAGDEVAELDDDDKRVLGYLVKQIHEMYHFKSNAS